MKSASPKQKHRKRSSPPKTVATAEQRVTKPHPEPQKGLSKQVRNPQKILYIYCIQMILR